LEHESLLEEVRQQVWKGSLTENGRRYKKNQIVSILNSLEYLPIEIRVIVDKENNSFIRTNKPILHENVEIAPPYKGLIYLESKKPLKFRNINFCRNDIQAFVDRESVMMQDYAVESLGFPEYYVKDKKLREDALHYLLLKLIRWNYENMKDVLPHAKEEMQENVNNEFTRHDKAIQKIDRIRSYYRVDNKKKRSLNAVTDQDDKFPKRRRYVTMKVYSSSKPNAEQIDQNSYVSTDDILDADDDDYHGEGL
jgi:hypothetical protein